MNAASARKRDAALPARLCGEDFAVVLDLARWRSRARGARGEPAPASQAQLALWEPAKGAGSFRSLGGTRADEDGQKRNEPTASDCHKVVRHALAEIVRATEALVDGERELAHAILSRLEEDLASKLAAWERSR